jgi:hypothetical protein
MRGDIQKNERHTKEWKTYTRMGDIHKYERQKLEETYIRMRDIHNNGRHKD